MARLIAIDLGADAVKVSVFQGSSKETTLEDEVSRRVPQDGTAPPGIADRLAVLDLVLRDHPDWASGARQVALAWPSSRIATHRLQLPFTDRETIEKTLPGAVEAEVPFDLDDMVLAWRPADDQGAVLAILTPPGPLEEALEGLAQRGFDPRRVYADGELLARYAGYDDTVTAVVDVGHEHTTVVVARAGKALTWRALGVAGRTFTRVVQEALGCSWAEADLLKHGLGDDLDVDDDEGPLDALTVGPADDDGPSGPALDHGDDDPSTAAERTEPVIARAPTKVREALDGALGLLLAEIRSTLVQAEDDLKVEIEEVVLTGGGARVPELRGYLEQDLGLPVHDPGEVGGVPVRSELAVTRALALHLADADADALTDLRVGDLAWRGGMDATRAVLGYGTAFLGIYLVIVAGIFGYKYAVLAGSLGEHEEAIRTSVAALVPDLPADLDATSSVTLLGELVADAQDEAEFLGDASAAPPTVDLLHQLTQAFPPHPDVRVNVDELDITARAIQIRGVTDGFAQVDQIGQSLGQSGRFSEVVATPGNKDRSGKLQFTVDITRDGEGAAGLDALGEEG